ncbi:MAG: hypothetical protein V4656_09420 [Pseudomonadota bacterium]
MSERTKHLIATGASALEAAMVCLADPARANRSARVGARTEPGSILALSGQRLFAQRQIQTRRLAAGRRPALPVSGA